MARWSECADDRHVKRGIEAHSGLLVRDSHPIISIIGEQVERITAEWLHLTEEAPPERLSEIPSVV